jgi:hypothetical protein
MSSLGMILSVHHKNWLVLPEKSDSGFSVVNPADEAAIALAPQFWGETFSIYGFQNPPVLGDFGGENLNL